MIQRAADRCGFRRESFQDRNLPTNRSNIRVVHFAGDIRSEAVISSLLLSRECSRSGGKYTILCSYNNHSCLFPYVDEYWSVVSGDDQEEMISEADGLDNPSGVYAMQRRSLNYFFDDVVGGDAFAKFYDGKLTRGFYEAYGEIERFLPNIPSVAILNQKLMQELGSRSGRKVAILPYKRIRCHTKPRKEVISIPRSFYEHLCLRLLDRGWVPVVIGGSGRHDLSRDVSGSIYSFEDEMGARLSSIRACDCLLDIFAGSHCYAMLARSPYVAIDERKRRETSGGFELEDICGQGLSKTYIYSFLSLLENGGLQEWSAGILDPLCSRMAKFFESIPPRDLLPTTSESRVVIPREAIRGPSIRKVGMKFLKVERY